MKQVLVTGGAGYIGAHTVVELHKAGFEAVIVDNFSNSEPKVLEGLEKLIGQKPLFEQVDCLDYEAMDRVFTQYPNICAVIHFAASKAVGESVEKPLLYYKNNLLSLVNLLNLMKAHGVQNIVFSSSCTVYGQPEVLPVDESAPFQPATSPYGYTKQVCETILRDTVHAAKDGSLHCVALRYFNPIGAHPSALIGELPRGVPQNLIPFVTQTAAGIRPCLKVFGHDYNTPDGSCIRDYIYVVDLAKAHIAALRYMLKPESPRYDVFNIGTGTGVSVLEIVKGFEEATDVKLNYSLAPRREGDIEKVWGNPAKANRLLEWEAKTPLKDILASAWNWQKTL